MLKKILAVLFLNLIFPSIVFAGNISAIPETKKTLKDCGIAMKYVEAKTPDFIEGFGDQVKEFDIFDQKYSQEDILACSIKTGDISLWMVPYFLRYIMQLLISLSGIIAMGAIIAGGYMYLFAGITEDKETGKKAIKYGFAGIIVVMISWYAVEVLILVLTL